MRQQEAWQSFLHPGISRLKENPKKSVLCDQKEEGSISRNTKKGLHETFPIGSASTKMVSTSENITESQCLLFILYKMYCYTVLLKPLHCFFLAAVNKIQMVELNCIVNGRLLYLNPLSCPVPTSFIYKSFSKETSLVPRKPQSLVDCSSHQSFVQEFFFFFLP